MKALIILNPQIDFCSGGALAIPGASELLNRIKNESSKFDKIICLKEIHPANHSSFAGNHLWRKPGQQLTIDDNDVELMISHCVESQFGSFLLPIFKEFPFDLQIELGKVIGLETDFELERNPLALLHFLESNQISSVAIRGLAHNSIDEVLQNLLVTNGIDLLEAEILKYQRN